MLFYLTRPSSTYTHYEQVIDTDSGIIYNFHQGKNYLTFWSIHSLSDNFTKMDGPSTAAFWAHLKGRACPVDTELAPGSPFNPPTTDSR